MKKSLFLSFLLTAIWPMSTWGTLENTIAHIEGLLAEGKKVAILLIDMQTNMMDKRFYPEAEDIGTVMKEQIGLLNHFSARDNVYFVDVNYVGQGGTLPDIHVSLKKNARYKFFMKTTDSSFATIPKPGSVTDPDQISTALQTYLKTENISDIMVTGCFDAACVLKTADDGLRNGFNVAVDRDLNMLVDRAFPYSEDRASYDRILDDEWLDMMKNPLAKKLKMISEKELISWYSCFDY